MKPVSSEKLSELLRTSAHIVITTHMNPDGDALGSSAGLYHYLKAREKDVRIVLADPVPQTISFIYEGITVSDISALKECDLLICVDFNVVDRAGKIAQDIKDCKAAKVLIDHHVGPDLAQFDLVYSETQISSASELVYWILADMEGNNSLGPDAMRCLMTGMTTDTNNFANSVFPSTMQMATNLLAAGVDRDAILNNLYSSYRPNRVQAMSYMLDRCLKFSHGSLAYIVITKELWHRFGLQEGELEGLVNIPLSIKEVNYSMTLRQDNGFFRVSLRSKKGWSARNLASKYFHGGGHEQASGGRLYFPQDIAKPQDVDAFIENLEI